LTGSLCHCEEESKPELCEGVPSSILILLSEVTTITSAHIAPHAHNYCEHTATKRGQVSHRTIVSVSIHVSDQGRRPEEGARSE
jgi:hypothetical protein